MSNSLAICATLFLLLAVFLAMRKTFSVSVYRYRSVFLCAMIPPLLLMLVMLLQAQDVPVRQVLQQVPGTFTQLSAAAFGVLGIWMAVSNVALIRHEGMSFHNALGTILYAAVIFSVDGVYILLELLKTMGVEDAALRFLQLFFSIVIAYVQCILLGTMVMGWVAATRKPKYDKDFIIIPGCSISKTGGLLPLLKGRVNRAVRYAWEQEIATGKKVRFVPSGGKGSDEIMSEGSAMELYLLSHSAEQDEVFPEKRSVNTRENFLFSANIIKEQKKDARVAFATTNYHVFRCGLLARQAGLDAEGIASGTKWYFWPNGFARELVAICVMTKTYHAVAAGLILLACIAYTVL